ncbi:GntR family transcriptional regulator [Oceanobacillus jeddahense]|uniref:GntR family transcriptional regulator n=1 Tax=Oceanobacillus jeddahense TaxID=1462527 RepID=UPI000595A82A|nr:GntR family transcriptional regulator [Oceanobacillus jeddahense]
MTQKRKRVVKYKLIETDILQKIKSGEYMKGQLIETEQELAKQYNVSRVTVRQATNNLVAKGYLSRSQGSGTYVTSQNVVGRTTVAKSFTEEMHELGKKVTTEVLDFKIIPASEEISYKLQIEKEMPTYYIRRLRKADDEPIQLETSYMNVKDYPDLSYENISESKYKYIEENKNLTIDFSHHIVVPIMPTEEIANYFECDLYSPLLKVLNTTYLTTGEVMDFSELILNTDKYQYQSYRSK